MSYTNSAGAQPVTYDANGTIPPGSASEAAVIKSTPQVIDYRQFGAWLQPNQDIGGNFQAAINQLSPGQVLAFHGKDPFLFSQGAVSQKKIGIIGSGPTLSRFVWQPSVAGGRFISFNGNNLSFAGGQVNEDYALDGSILRNFEIRGNRGIQTNAISLSGVDNIDIENVRVHGVKGYSLRLRNTRESTVRGWRSRWCGYQDKSSFHVNSLADIIEDTYPSWYAQTTQAIVGSASPQTVNITNRLYTDEDGVLRNMAAGSTITVGFGLPGVEQVLITALTNTTMTGVFLNSHPTGTGLSIYGDRTNLNNFIDVRSIFPFWHSRSSEYCSDEYAQQWLTHMLSAPDNANGVRMEQQAVMLFGGSLGFTSGNPNNVYAELCETVTGNEANCTGLKFDRDGYMWASPSVAIKATSHKYSELRVVGGGTNYGVVVLGNANQATIDTGAGDAVCTEVAFNNSDIGSINATFTGQVTPFNFVGWVGSVDTSTDIISAPAGISVPPTGMPIVFKHASNDANLPAGLQGFGICMYVIKISTNTFRAAKTRARALAGIYEDITSTGTGTHYILPLTGCFFAMAEGGQVITDHTVKLSGAFQAFMKDGYPSVANICPYGSSLMGVPRVSTMSSQQQYPYILGTAAMAGAGIQYGASTEALSFFGATTTTRPSGAAQAAVSGTAGATYTAAEQAIINNAVTLLNKLRADQVTLGLIKGSA